MRAFQRAEREALVERKRVQQRVHAVRPEAVAGMAFSLQEPRDVKVDVHGRPGSDAGMREKLAVKQRNSRQGLYFALGLVTRVEEQKKQILSPLMRSWSAGTKRVVEKTCF